jgi:hypothetical protein
MTFSDLFPWYWDGKNWFKGKIPNNSLFGTTRYNPKYFPVGNGYLALNPKDQKVYAIFQEEPSRYKKRSMHSFVWEKGDWVEKKGPIFPYEFTGYIFGSAVHDLVILGGRFQYGFLEGDIHGLHYDGVSLKPIKGHFFPKETRGIVYDKKRDQVLCIDPADYPPRGTHLTGTPTTWALRGEDFVRLQYQDPKGPWVFGLPLLAFHEELGEPFMVESRRSRLGFKEPRRNCWLWNGKGWQIQLGGKPLMVQPTALTYHRDRKTPIVLGKKGFLWEWTRKGGWSKLPNSKTPNTPEYVMTMAYDPSRKRIVLSGHGNGELYEWDGTLWRTLRPKPAPLPRYSHLKYVEDLGGIVMVGGADRNHSVFLRDTWVWNGKSWKQLNVQVDPDLPELELWGFCFDSKRRRLVGAKKMYLDNASRIIQLQLPSLESDRSLLHVGQSFTLHGRLKGQAGNLFVLLFSEGLWPGIELQPISALQQSMILPLKPTPLFDVGLRAGLQVIVNRQESIRWTIPVPRDTALYGFRSYWAGLPINPQAKVEMVTNPVGVEFGR